MARKPTNRFCLHNWIIHFLYFRSASLSDSGVLLTMSWNILWRCSTSVSTSHSLAFLMIILSKCCCFGAFLRVKVLGQLFTLNVTKSRSYMFIDKTHLAMDWLLSHWKISRAFQLELESQAHQERERRQSVGSSLRSLDLSYSYSKILRWETDWELGRATSIWWMSEKLVTKLILVEKSYADTCCHM